MRNDRQNIIEIINGLKEEILEDKERLGKINNLATQLKEIENVLKPKQKDFKEKIKNLDKMLEELSEVKFNIIWK